MLSAVCCLVWIIETVPARLSLANTITGTIIKVSTTADELNNDGECSLREAVRAANLDEAVDTCPAGSGADTIILGIGTYPLNLDGVNEDAALTKDLDITDNLSIIGVSTSQTVINGNHLDRIFEVVGPVTVHISYLSIQDGMVTDEQTLGGGAILNSASSSLFLSHVALVNNTSQKTGGALQNAGNAFLTYVTLDGNHSNPLGAGGAIFNIGTLEVQNSLFSNNTAFSSETDYGGGLYNSNIATLTNVTFSGNSADWGGGLFNDGTEAYLTNITFTNNTIGIYNQSDNSLWIKNSIVANSTEINCAGHSPINSLGYNLDSENECYFDGPGDMVDTNPMLADLADNQGPTLTHALLAGSQAIDHANPTDCLFQDQRGMLRPADGDENETRICDIGAYEYLAVFPVILFLPVIVK